MKSFASRSSFHIPNYIRRNESSYCADRRDAYKMDCLTSAIRILFLASDLPPSDSMSCKAAYVTLLTKTSYLPGVLVLDHCLRSVGSQYPLVVMTTPTLPKSAKTTLQKRGIPVREVGWLHPRHAGHCVDARFEETWTKLRYDCF
jgi:hypothetical protein